MNIDWSKAPEGATHFDSRGNGCSIGFMKPGMRTGEWEYFGHGGHWTLLGLLYRELQNAMLERPDVAVWSGEGPPPVGLVCEVSHSPELPDNASSWKEVVILAHFTEIPYLTETIVVYMPKEGTRHCDQAVSKCFRPIRTAEQIAAEEEKSIIDEHAKGGLYGIAKALHSDGYRKQEQK